MILTGYQVVLKPIEQQDLELLRNWRNDPDVSRFMVSQEPISRTQQQAWFERIKQDPCQRHWLILYKDKPIGAANIKCPDEGQTIEQTPRLEPGLYIADKQYRGNILAFAPTLLLNDYCFGQLGVQQLVARVKADNQAAIKYNQRLGYRIEGEDEMVDISLNQADYEQASGVIKALLSR